jgi:hypothetical protein
MDAGHGAAHKRGREVFRRVEPENAEHRVVSISTNWAIWMNLAPFSDLFDLTDRAALAENIHAVSWQLQGWKSCTFSSQGGVCFEE